MGAGNSGAEIALELAGHHQTWLSGPDTGQEPTRAGSVPDRLFTPLMWLMATRLTVTTTMGRKLRDHFLDPPEVFPLAGHGERTSSPQVSSEAAKDRGDARDPVLENGRVLEVANVIWCTGYTPDYGWIDFALQTPMPIPHPRPWHRAVCPGLYFIGLPFLYSLSSALLGGVGRDAHHIVEHIVSTGPARLGHPRPERAEVMAGGMKRCSSESPSASGGRPDQMSRFA